MDNFKNEDVIISSLPKYKEAKANTIQPKYWTVMVISNFFRFIFLGGIIISMSFVINELESFIWYIVAAVIILWVLYFILLKKSFKFRSYGLREYDIFYRHGILSRKTTIIPFNRIQHIAINEGFIPRYFKLAQLQIFTAGSDSDDLKISGLLKEDAEKIKEAILGRIEKKIDENLIEDQNA